MTAVTVFRGSRLEVTADPDELRDLARAIRHGEPGWRERVDALPRNILTRQTLQSEAAVIAARLVNCAIFLERCRNGVAFTAFTEPAYPGWPAGRTRR